MAFTEEDWLPSYSDLKVTEIPLTAAPLKAGASYFGKYCENDCKEYMLCREEENDPRKCLGVGKNVTRCGLDIYTKIRDNCASEFTKYWQCLDHANGYFGSMDFTWCRQTQQIFEKCMKEKLGIDKPKLGYLSKVKVHKTSRPAPVLNLPLPEPVPDLPDPKLLPKSETSDNRKFGTGTGSLWGGIL